MLAGVKRVLGDVLLAFYQPFWFALILSIFYMLVRQQYPSLKEALIKWGSCFKRERTFRKQFLLTFCSVLILFKTLFGRALWANPLSNVIGNFKIIRYLPEDDEWHINAEVFENFLLFVPFAFLLLWNYREKICGEKVTFWKVVWKSTYIVFLFSFTIEMLQLFLRVGTWQLSDLFYNTLGGCLGGIIYYFAYRIHVICRKTK